MKSDLVCICSNLDSLLRTRSYLVFRAENSNTHRHLTEFTGLDIEMAIESDYTEVLDMLDGLLLHIFRGLQSRYRTEVFTNFTSCLTLPCIVP